MRQMRTRHSSTLSRCKRWREPLEFLTRIGDRKAPINSRLLRIALVFPGRDCARERGFVGNTTVEALGLAEGFPVVGVQKTTILLWFRSSHRPLRGTPHDGGVHARLLPEVRRPPPPGQTGHYRPRGWRDDGHIPRQERVPESRECPASGPVREGPGRHQRAARSAPRALAGCP